MEKGPGRQSFPGQLCGHSAEPCCSFPRPSWRVKGHTWTCCPLWVLARSEQASDLFPLLSLLMPWRALWLQRGGQQVNLRRLASGPGRALPPPTPGECSCRPQPGLAWDCSFGFHNSCWKDGSIITWVCLLLRSSKCFTDFLNADGLGGLQLEHTERRLACSHEARWWQS